jgi:hypothetical protein
VGNCIVGSNPILSAISFDFQCFTNFTPGFTPRKQYLIEVLNKKPTASVGFFYAVLNFKRARKL